MQETQEASSDSSESEHSYTVLQLGTKSNKFLITVHINRVPVEMEVDHQSRKIHSSIVNFSTKVSRREQVKEEELIPINKSEWAAPILVVRKKDGGIRICGDFKVSINPFLHSKTYPLPTPEEMFSTLANGEAYTKLDLARAYKQMKVRKECLPLLTINTHCGLFQYT